MPKFHGQSPTQISTTTLTPATSLPKLPYTIPSMIFANGPRMESLLPEVQANETDTAEASRMIAHPHAQTSLLISTRVPFISDRHLGLRVRQSVCWQE